MTAVGSPSDGSISKSVVAIQTNKLRSKIVQLEDLYYGFRDEIEEALQEAKYRLDKLEQLLGDHEDATE